MVENTPEKSGKIAFRKDQAETKISFRHNKTDAKDITNPDGSPLRNKDNVRRCCKA